MHPSAQQFLVRIEPRGKTGGAGARAASAESGSKSLEEGTLLHWCEMGPEDSAPVDGGKLVSATKLPPLVLLHGLCDCHRTWRKVAPILAQRRRVLMPDLPGHGLSGRPNASYAIDWHADIIGRWLEQLGLNEVDMVGHSYGGGVAQWLLLDNRVRVRRLALLAPGGLGRDVTVGLRLASASTIVEHLGQPFMGPGTRIAMGLAGGCFSREDIQVLSWMNAMPGSARAFARTVADVIDWRGQRRHFSQRAGEVVELPPIALFWGDRDRVIPHRHLSEMEKTIELADSFRFAGSGHFPHHERPEEFCQRLEAYFDAKTARPSRLRAPLSLPKSVARPTLGARVLTLVADFLRNLWPIRSTSKAGVAASPASKATSATESEADATPVALAG